MFWILIFPIILGTFFFLAFSKISSSTEEFETIEIAVVISDDDVQSNAFKQMVDSLSVAKEGELPLFKPVYTDSENAAALLDKGDVTAIVTFSDSTPAVTISKNGINQTIVKSVMDSYIQTAAVLQLTDGNPEKIANVMAVMHGNAEKIIEKKLTDGDLDNMADYYYALVAMCCMFASLSGLNCATKLGANLSGVGMRKCISPVNKMKIILSDSMANYLIQLFSNAVLIVYLKYILKVTLGGNFFLIFLVAAMGSLIAMNIGILIGSIPNLSEGGKIGINISISLVSSFMSGLMVGGIKQAIEKHVPFVNRINPSSLISDALYALNIYDDYKVYTQRIIIMAAMSFVLVVVSFLITRRAKYDSI